MGKIFLSRFSAIVVVQLILFSWIAFVASESRESMQPKTIETVIKEHSESLMALPGVVGVAQGLCGARPCIKVFVDEKTPELEKRIPTQIEGYSVEMEETGRIRALPKE